MATHYDRRDVDRMYRTLLDRSADLWLTQPSYDSQPRERRPVDELPAAVTDHMNRVQALEQLPSATQRIIFKIVVMGLIRAWDGKQWVDVRIAPMTYAQASAYLEMSEGAVAKALMRARRNLAAILAEHDERDAAEAA